MDLRMSMIPITDDCLHELISSQKLPIILVYVDGIAMSSMLYGDNNPLGS